MNAEERLKQIHEEVDKFNANNRKAMGNQPKIKSADLLMIEQVQAAFVHALVDMRIKHDMRTEDIEDAICAQVANMMSLFLRSAVPDESGPIALIIGKRMSDKMECYLYDAIVSNFKNTGEGPTDDDKVH